MFGIDKIPLTGERGKGKYIIVDKENADYAKQFKWSLHSCGYATRGKNNGATFYLHREIMNAQKGQIIDHINGDKLDNRKSNLRFCTDFENTKNRDKSNGNYTSKYKGVYLDKKRNKWIAQITYNYKAINLGGFDTQEKAAQAYNEKAKELYKEFAKLNILEGLCLAS